MNSHYFVGIQVPRELAGHLSSWQHTLQKHMRYKVWTNAEDFHVTLKFLGAASDEKINRLMSMLQQQNLPDAFSTTVGPAGGFGHPEAPRVFLAEVEKPPGLVKLYKRVEEAAAASGWEREKRDFHPHITLAKKQAEGRSPLSLSHVPAVFQQQFSIMVERITLYRIHPGENPKYKDVFTIDL
ncbi:RNA 2',3'-cyclic phosphodiesterase [Halobacillus litoralis]|uniref:RNA 2',3'-cyclic phosphodiesterase n=1 Tax=Halobacillus litoralis TaxID=45668 RepID=A0A845DRG5_9BACI|nr:MULTISPECIES: RNA 2',3'-cyclic phosphodiesterase [Halobacillus]MYL20090.1 RNA 2',3'-cyclic phosphodiesterase [Halobacillus litoralis]MYL29222.1 RNA 2',3'-cyclic phosphodiesterase [Halobacillus halophilus]MYL38926.1 RNA 2',3'-cyclic phosphodiesterase [Halobacillus litoralis]